MRSPQSSQQSHCTNRHCTLSRMISPDIPRVSKANKERTKTTITKWSTNRNKQSVLLLLHPMTVNELLYMGQIEALTRRQWWGPRIRRPSRRKRNNRARRVWCRIRAADRGHRGEEMVQNGPQRLMSHQHQLPMPKARREGQAIDPNGQLELGSDRWAMLPPALDQSALHCNVSKKEDIEWEKERKLITFLYILMINVIIYCCWNDSMNGVNGIRPPFPPPPLQYPHSNSKLLTCCNNIIGYMQYATAMPMGGGLKNNNRLNAIRVVVSSSRTLNY